MHSGTAIREVCRKETACQARGKSESSPMKLYDVRGVAIYEASRPAEAVHTFLGYKAETKREALERCERLLMQIHPAAKRCELEVIRQTLAA
jgi:hypothetical protein